MAETNTQQTGTGASEQPFYNVMPKAKVRSPKVNVETRQSPPAPEQHATPAPGTIVLPSRSRGKKALNIIITVLAVLVLGFGAYLGYVGWYKPRQEKLVAPTNTPPPPPQAVTPPPAPPVLTTTPAAWQLQFFGSDICAQQDCLDAADPDSDGLANIAEFEKQTVPVEPDSDSDGLADGDEVNIFGSNPLNQRTAGNKDYTDADDAKGGYDTTTGKKYTDERLAEVRNNVEQYSFHEPTLTTLKDSLNMYQGEVVPAHFDNSPAAQLDRDTQRLNTVKKLGIALFKYYQVLGEYPETNEFEEMVIAVKPYNPVATNPLDPINQGPYVYTYASLDGKDFIITYYSETQKQKIHYSAERAAKDANLEVASNNDQLRVGHLEGLRSALLIYSAANAGGTKEYVFPTKDTYKTELAPKYLTEIPTDPKTQADYEYSVTDQFDSFTIKAILENPVLGTTGYQCSETGCDTY